MFCFFDERILECTKSFQLCFMVENVPCRFMPFKLGVEGCRWRTQSDNKARFLGAKALPRGVPAAEK